MTAAFQIIVCYFMAHEHWSRDYRCRTPPGDCNKGLQSINSGRKELHIASISPGFSPAMKKAAHTIGGTTVKWSM